ncbi:hypothetical protein E4T56_gene2140, partial [Termitomyces sp. T112]
MEGQYPDWWRKGCGATTTPATPSTPQATSATTPQANSAVTSANNADNPRCLAFSTLTSTTGENGPVTYADSAASQHFFTDRWDFVMYHEPSAGNKFGRTARGTFDIAGCGRVRKWVKYDGAVIEVTFEDALHAPGLDHNLVSIGCLVKKGVRLGIDEDGATLRAPDGRPFMRCPMAATRSLHHPVDLETWHRRLGHIGEGTIRDMIRGEMVEGLTVTKMLTNGKCEDCIMGKQVRRPFDAVVEPESKPFERVALDLWGPARVQTTGGKVWMMVATDQGGADCEAWYLAHKSKEASLFCLETYDLRVETQYSARIKVVRTDGGGEFENSLWEGYCRKWGIKHEVVSPHSSSANGVVERRNRTILDLARSMLSDSRLPAHYWGEATSTAIHVLDLVPSSRHPGKTPYEIRTGSKPEVSYLRPFGCTAYAKVLKEDGASKLDARLVKCMMVGYFGRGDYKLLEHTTGQIFQSRDVVFEEGLAHRTLPDACDGPAVDLFEILDIPTIEPSSRHVNLSEQTVSSGDNALVAPQTTQTPPGPNHPAPAQERVLIPAEPRHSERLAARAAPSGAPAAGFSPQTPPDDNPSDPESEEETYASMPGALSTYVGDPDDVWVPKSYSEAMKRPDLWKGLMDEEMKRMDERKVWRLVERPVGARTMKNRWVFALKYDVDGK